ncbi:metal-sensitive transcriptional regulator [Paenibacillus aquistagni]|uniref:metal-sensitive transcriptional regulator n=1 Tax=Paenibacillus aquistagni TaxID=1852522 RepID=UPI00145BD291|nr:metal-sensitive transcriptional regulator [Paenibacillus aquistagni]NMM51603.1 metal-sensitive transcriptional regulator [Paenibacillus aquistagni]
MKYDHDVKMRLKRIEGQARGVLNMMEQEKHCKDVVSQLTAIRNAADRAIASIVAANLEKCILEDTGASGASLDTSKYVKEAVDLLVKSR